MTISKFMTLFFIVIFSFIAGRYSYYLQDINFQNNQHNQLDEVSNQNAKVNSRQVYQQNKPVTSEPANELIQAKNIDNNTDIITSKTDPTPLKVNKVTPRVLDSEIDFSNKSLSQVSYHSNVLYSSQDIEHRLAAIEILTSLLASDEIAIGLGDNEPIIRIKAIEGLKQIASDNAIRYIGQSLYSTNSVETKLAAISALSELSYHPNANQFLRYSSQKDNNERIRKAALIALGEYSNEN